MNINFMVLLRRLNINTHCDIHGNNRLNDALENTRNVFYGRTIQDLEVLECFYRIYVIDKFFVYDFQCKIVFLLLRSNDLRID